jgi:hypothetical protein
VESVHSKDGTTVAFDRLGNGPTVIVVGGGTCDRAMNQPLPEQLAQRSLLTRRVAPKETYLATALVGVPPLWPPTASE